MYVLHAQKGPLSSAKCHTVHFIPQSHTIVVENNIPQDIKGAFFQQKSIISPLDIYRIRPNYRTGCLGVSKLLVKLVVKYVSTCTVQPLLSKHPRDNPDVLA